LDFMIPFSSFLFFRFVCCTCPFLSTSFFSFLPSFLPSSLLLFLFRIQVNFIIFAIVSGGIFFKEFNAFGVWNWVGFVAGVLLLIFGIFLLSPTQNITDNGPAARQHDIQHKQRRASRQSLALMTHLAARQQSFFPDTDEFKLLRALESASSENQPS
jgi:hypothetical protein